MMPRPESKTLKATRFHSIFREDGDLDTRLLAQVLLGFSAAAIYVLVVLSGVGRFATSDDPSMILIASGRFGSAYSSNQIWTSPPLGLLMSHLYAASSSIAWWGLLQAASFTFAIVLLIAALPRGSGSFWLAYLAVSFLALATTLMLLKMNFTQPAIFCAAAGLIVVSLTKSNLLTFLGLGLVIIGAAWRQQGVYIAVALVVFALAATVICDWRDRSVLSWKRMVGSLFFGVFAVILVAWGARRIQLLGDPTLQRYQEFIAAFSHLDGMGNYVYSETAFQRAASLGLSPSEWGLVFEWLLADSQVYSTETLQAIAAGRPIMPELRSLPRLGLEFADSLARFPVWVLALCGLAAVGLVALPSRKQLVKVAAIFLAGLTVMFVIFLYGRLPERVSVPSVLALVAVALVAVTVNPTTTRIGKRVLPSARVRHKAIAFGVLVCFVPAILIVGTSAAVSRPTTPAFADVAVCLPPGKPVVLSTSFVAPELIKLPVNFDPFRDVQNGPLLVLDWWQRSPGFVDYRESLGLMDEVLESVIKGKAWLVTNSPQVPGLLAGFASDNYPSRLHEISIHPCAESDAIFVLGLDQLRRPTAAVQALRGDQH